MSAHHQGMRCWWYRSIERRLTRPVKVIVQVSKYISSLITNWNQCTAQVIFQEPMTISSNFFTSVQVIPVRCFVWDIGVSRCSRSFGETLKNYKSKSMDEFSAQTPTHFINRLTLASVPNLRPSRLIPDWFTRTYHVGNVLPVWTRLKCNNS